MSAERDQRSHGSTRRAIRESVSALERIVTQVDRIDWGSRWKQIDVVRLERPREPDTALTR